MHSQKEKKEKKIYLYIKKQEESNQINKQRGGKYESNEALH